MRAARRGDHIGHTHRQEGLKVGAIFGAVAGAGLAVAGAAGLVAGIGATILTGGLAAPLVIAAALTTVTGVGMVLTGGALGASIGEFVGSLSIFGTVTGKIDYGSPDVYINSKQAARVAIDSAPCSKSPKVVALIATGSSNVYINGHPAARLDDKVSCGAIIKEGSENVYIGGEEEKVLTVGEEVPDWVHEVVAGAGYLGAFLTGGLAATAAMYVGSKLSEIGGEVLGKVAKENGEMLSENYGGLPSDWEKFGEFAGQAAGGGLAAKGGKSIKGRKYDPNTLYSIFGVLPLSPARPRRSVGDTRGPRQIEGSRTPGRGSNLPPSGVPPARSRRSLPLFRPRRLRTGPKHGDLGNKKVGGLAEKAVIDRLKAKGFTQILQIQNKSGHGVDIIARNPETGAVKAVEVKANSSELNKDQAKGGKWYINDRLRRAKNRERGYGVPPNPLKLQAKARVAQKWINDAPNVDYEIHQVPVNRTTGEVGESVVKPW